MPHLHGRFAAATPQNKARPRCHSCFITESSRSRSSSATSPAARANAMASHPLASSLAPGASPPMLSANPKPIGTAPAREAPPGARSQASAPIAVLLVWRCHGDGVTERPASLSSSSSSPSSISSWGMLARSEGARALAGPMRRLPSSGGDAREGARCRRNANAVDAAVGCNGGGGRRVPTRGGSALGGGRADRVGERG